MQDEALTIIAQDLKPEMRTGFARYVDTILSELRKAGVEFRVLRLPLWDFRLGPVHAGYYPRLLLYQTTVRPRGAVHTFLPYVVPPSTKVVTFQGLGLRHEQPVMNWINQRSRRKLLRYPAAYVVVSETAKRGMADELGVQEDRIHVAPPGVDLDMFHPGAGPRPTVMADGKTVVLHLGLGQRRKGAHLVVEALGRLGPERFHLIRVGTASEPAYVAEYTARAKGLGLQLSECGYVADRDLAAYYANADVFVFPSARESASMTPVEAMACGTNVVVSDIPTHREVCGPLGFFAPLEPQGLSRAIEDALAHGHPASDLRQHALRYSWVRSAKVYADLYRELGIA